MHSDKDFRNAQFLTQTKWEMTNSKSASWLHTSLYGHATTVRPCVPRGPFDVIRAPFDKSCTTLVVQHLRQNLTNQYFLHKLENAFWWTFDKFSKSLLTKTWNDELEVGLVIAYQLVSASNDIATLRTPCTVWRDSCTIWQVSHHSCNSAFASKSHESIFSP